MEIFTSISDRPSSKRLGIFASLQLSFKVHSQLLAYKHAAEESTLPLTRGMITGHLLVTKYV